MGFEGEWGLKREWEEGDGEILTGSSLVSLTLRYCLPFVFDLHVATHIPPNLSISLT